MGTKEERNIDAIGEEIKVANFLSLIAKHYNSNITIFRSTDQKQTIYKSLRKKYKLFDNQTTFCNYSIEVCLENNNKIYLIFTEVNDIKMKIDDNSKLIWGNQDVLWLGKGAYFIKIYINDNDYISFKFKKIKKIV